MIHHREHYACFHFCGSYFIVLFEKPEPHDVHCIVMSLKRVIFLSTQDDCEGIIYIHEPVKSNRQFWETVAGNVKSSVFHL